MSLRRYRLNATSVLATADALDVWTTQRPGTIKQIQFAAKVNSITDNSSFDISFSRSAVGDTGAVGGAVTQSLCQMSGFVNFVTSGLGITHYNYTYDCNDKVTIGEAFYLNAVIAGTLALTLDVIVVVEEAGA